MKLKYARIEVGITQGEFAEIMGVSQTMVSADIRSSSASLKKADWHAPATGNAVSGLGYPAENSSAVF